MRVGAAVGVGEDSLDRAKALVAATVVVMIGDSADGVQERVVETV